MVDPRTSDLLRGADARAVYLAELGKTRRFRALCAGGATLVEGPRGWDASMYWSTRYVDERTLLVGDAGSFVDPLSSAGVRKALISAWVAAIAVHTALVRPDRRDLALQFFNARETEMYDRLRGLTADHLTDAARGHDDPFWSAREFPTGLPHEGSPRRFPTEVPHGGSPRRFPTEVPHEGSWPDAIRTAHDQIRRDAATDLQLAPGVRVEPRPVIEGREIVPAPHVVGPDEDAVRFLHDVEIPLLIDVATRTTDPGAMFQDYCRRRGAVPLPQFLTALATLVARGWLCYNNRTTGFP